MSYSVEINNLNKQLGGFALKDITFSLSDSKIISLIGSNGSGKSTLLKILAGLIIPDSGELKIFGEELNKIKKNLRNKISIVSDELIFAEDQQIREELKYIYEIFADWDDKISSYLIEKLCIDVEKKYKELSKGMKQKLNFVIALSHQSIIYLLDEPFTGIDNSSKNYLIEILKEKKQEGSTIVLVSHQKDELLNLTDEVIVLSDGKLVLRSEYDCLEDWYKIEFISNNLSLPHYVSAIELKSDDNSKIWLVKRDVEKVENYLISNNCDIINSSALNIEGLLGIYNYKEQVV